MDSMKNFIKKVIARILEWEARSLLYRMRPKVIGVAGSVGKTSTKDAIFTALNPYYRARRSEKSFNSEFGLPLTILDLPTGWNNPFIWIYVIFRGLWRSLFYPKIIFPELLILEIGSDRPGDMDRIVNWLRLDMVVLTCCPNLPVHVENFDSPEDVNKEDKKIIKALKKGGVAILNADDVEIMQLEGKIDQKIITYGFKAEAMVKASDYENLLSKFLGKSPGYAVLAALATAKGLDLDLSKVEENLAQYESPKGRMKMIEGINGSRIIDDTYNSSPIAVEEALNVLGGITEGGRRIAVLGDMLELGKFTKSEHKRIGSLAKGKVDMLLTVGMRAEDFAVGARGAHLHHSKIHEFLDLDSAVHYLKKHINKGDTVLVKGSQGMRMEKIVKEIMADPKSAKSLLARQEKEWEKI